MANTLDALDSQPRRFIFVSSTSVYHQNDGTVVDESSPTNPAKFNGRIVLEGERLVTAFATGTVVRFSGIYGPGRTRMVERVKNNIRSDSQDRGYTNRIHVDDCAGVLTHLVNLTGSGSVESLYLASDCEPCTRVDLETFLASELGITERHSAGAEADTKGSSAKRIAGSKRCSNERLLQSGYEFLYPDFRVGYRQVLAAHDTP